MRLTRLLPASLFGRLTLILVAGLLASQLINLWLHLAERATLIQHSHGDFPDWPSRFGIHLGLTLIAVIAVSLIAVRLVTRPLQRLADAADAFGRDLESPPVPEHGPTEVRRAAAAFNRMQQRLQRLIAERGRALAAVSHDLRTPLTRLRLRAELVSDEELQRQIVADIDGMQAMLNATLDYLRDLRESESRRAIDMNALVRSLAADAELTGRTVTVAGLAHHPYTGRLTALKRALTNLLDNALKYGDAVTVRIEDDETRLSIGVEDNGPGIPEHALDRVTDAWYRVDASRSRATGGSGLGLAIASDIALQHGGELRLTNRAERGLAATLILPRQETARERA
ncbi:MAG: ATP-binding protein [Thiotrichales bacterium]